MTEYKTKRKEFDEYVKETNYWIDAFAVSDIDIDIKHEQTDDCCIANASYSPEDACAISRLQISWDEEPTPERIRDAAFHEFMEILLAPLWSLGELRFVTKEQMNAARHGIIARFKNCIFKPDIERRPKK